MFEQRTEGEQRSDPKNTSLWHVDYFGLKGLMTQQTQEKLISPLTTKKNLVRGPDPERGLISTKDNFLSAWQGKHLTKHLLFVLPCEYPFCSLKPQAPMPFLSSGGHRSLNCLTCPWVSYFYAALICMTFNLFFSCYSILCHLTIRPAKNLDEKKEKIFHPYRIQLRIQDLGAGT